MIFLFWKVFFAVLIIIWIVGSGKEIGDALDDKAKDGEYRGVLVEGIISLILSILVAIWYFIKYLK